MVYNNENRYYVYVWYIEDTEEVIYVGKGTGKRYLTKKRENSFFAKMINTHNCKSKILVNNLSEEDAFKLEIETIAYYRGIGCRLTNVLDGGDNPPNLKGIPKTNEWKAKASKSRKNFFKNNPYYLKQWSDKMKDFLKTDKGKLFIEKSKKAHKTQEYRKKVSERNKIICSSPEYKINQSTKLKEKWKDKYFYDKHYGKNNHRSQQVSQYTLNNEKIAIYDTVLEASNKTGINYSKIAAVARGERKTAGGFIWRYDNRKNLKNNQNKSNYIYDYSFCEKEVLQYDKNGLFIKNYKSISEAARINNYKNRTNIIACLKGKTKTAYGYIWKYSNK